MDDLILKYNLLLKKILLYSEGYLLSAIQTLTKYWTLLQQKMLYTLIKIPNGCAKNQHFYQLPTTTTTTTIIIKKYPCLSQAAKNKPHKPMLR